MDDITELCGGDNVKSSSVQTYYDGGKYISYCCGPTGPKGPSGGTGMKGPRTWEEAEKLKACKKIEFKFGEGEREKYERTLKMITKMGQKEDLDVDAIYTPILVKEKIDIKPEYKELAEKIEQKNSEKRDKFYVLIEQLEQLGCDQSEIYTGPTYENIPDEYYNIREYYDYRSCYIRVTCHEDTETYRLLSDQKNRNIKTQIIIYNIMHINLTYQLISQININLRNKKNTIKKSQVRKERQKESKILEIILKT